MPDPYPVVEIQEGWLLDEPEEEMGGKRKFWYRQEDGIDWLFKFPRPNTGEHWAEKVAAEIAALLDIPHAIVDLATFGGTRGSTTKSFTPGGLELVHGNQLLKRFFPEYNPDLTFGQSDHTFARIVTVMEHVFLDDEGRKQAKRRIAEYLVLDALIGNTDRHHENWGVVRHQEHGRWHGYVAPSFDHASSLGREIQDRRRQVYLREENVGVYIKKGRGAIYWSEDNRHGPSPLQLVQHAAAEYPELFRRALGRLDGVSEDAIVKTICRIPDDWISVLAGKFAIAVMKYNLTQLRMIN